MSLAWYEVVVPLFPTAASSLHLLEKLRQVGASWLSNAQVHRPCFQSCTLQSDSDALHSAARQSSFSGACRANFSFLQHAYGVSRMTSFDAGRHHLSRRDQPGPSRPRQCTDAKDSLKESTWPPAVHTASTETAACTTGMQGRAACQLPAKHHWNLQAAHQRSAGAGLSVSMVAPKSPGGSSASRSRVHAGRGPTMQQAGSLGPPVPATKPDGCLLTTVLWDTLVCQGFICSASCLRQW